MTSTLPEKPFTHEAQYQKNISDRQTTIVYSQVTTPPQFALERFEEWKRPIAWWLELNDGIAQHRLLASLGVNSSGILKSMMQDYFDQTKHDRDSRCVQSFIDNINDRFKRPAEEIAMQRISQWGDIRRKNNEGFKEFWCRFERLTNKLCALGIIWPGKVLYEKAFVAANMAEDQKSLVRATMELYAGQETVSELRILTGKLFDNAIQVWDDVYQNQGMDNEDSSHQERNCEEIAELQNARRPINKNRGDSLGKSVKNAQTAFGLNPGGGSGKGESANYSSGCRNCNSPSHWWRDCPNLLPRKNVFGKVIGEMESHRSLLRVSLRARPSR